MNLDKNKILSWIVRYDEIPLEFDMITSILRKYIEKRFTAKAERACKWQVSFDRVIQKCTGTKCCKDKIYLVVNAEFIVAHKNNE